MADKSLVRLRISSALLVRELLHLPEAELEAASVEVFQGGGEPLAVSLYVRYPGVPEGADEMSPTYTRQGDGGVELTGIEWYAHGRSLVLVPDAGPGDA